MKADECEYALKCNGKYRCMRYTKPPITSQVIRGLPLCAFYSVLNCLEFNNPLIVGVNNGKKKMD